MTFIINPYRFGGSGVTYTTLNPADKSPNLTLSGGNLVATGDTFSSGFARSVHAITGKKYFEAVFTSQVAGTATIGAGVAQSTANNAASLGYSTADGWAFWGQNTGARHNGSTAISGTSSVADVFGFAVDVSTGSLWISQNGSWLGGGDPAAGTGAIWTNLTGTLYAAACPWTGPVSTVITMRFDPATFSYSAPSGFGPITA